MKEDSERGRELLHDARECYSHARRQLCNHINALQIANDNHKDDCKNFNDLLKYYRNAMQSLVQLEIDVERRLRTIDGSGNNDGFDLDAARDEITQRVALFRRRRSAA